MQSNTIITEKAYAKINLALDVTGVLPNGYHSLRMIMETVDIHDDIRIEASDTPGIRLKCAYDYENVQVSEPLSTGPDNLVVKAATALLNKAAESGRISHKIPQGFDITLTKRIPMAAGLAGGSSDAAATLRGMNRILDTDFSAEDLMAIGVTIGADVPYCVRGGSALAEGIGDILTALPMPPESYLLIVKPPVDVSTAVVYKRIDNSASDVHPDVDGMIDALYASDLPGITSRLGNVLRDVTVIDHPVVSMLEQRMIELGACGALMSGSGPSVFGIFDDPEACHDACPKIAAEHPGMFCKETCFIAPYGE